MCRAYNFKYNMTQLGIHIYRLSTRWTSISLENATIQFHRDRKGRKEYTTEGSYRFYNLMVVNI